MPHKDTLRAEAAVCERHPDLAATFKALGHPARLEILRALAAGEEACCGKIVSSLPLAQSTVSQHLAVLKSAGLVRCEVVGRCCHYAIEKDAVAAFGASVAAFIEVLTRPSLAVVTPLPDQDNENFKDLP